MKQQKILIQIWTDTFNEELSPNCCESIAVILHIIILRLFQHLFILAR